MLSNYYDIQCFEETNGFITGAIRRIGNKQILSSFHQPVHRVYLVLCQHVDFINSPGRSFFKLLI